MSEPTKFQKWARENYRAGDSIDDMWHPEIQAECMIMNKEREEQLRKDKARIKEVVESVADIERQYEGNIVLYVSMPGSLTRTKGLTPDEKRKVKEGLPENIRDKVGLTKPLLGEFLAYEELETWRAKLREEFRKYGIPFIADGQTVVSIQRIPEIEEFADEAEKKLAKMVEAVIEDYDDATSAESVGTGPLYNPRDYPAKESLRARFKLRRKWMHFGVPDILKEVDLARWEAERKRTAAVWQEVQQGGIILLRKQMSEVVERLTDAVQPDEKGERKKFYATSVTNLQEFLGVFDQRNLAGDSELAAKVAEMRELIQGKDVEDFKKDDKLRAKIATVGGRVTSELKKLLVDASDRAIKLGID